MIPLPRAGAIPSASSLVLLHVTFILLILAMAVTPAPGSPYLPIARTALLVGADPLMVGVDEGGRFFVRSDSGWHPVPDAALVAEVRALFASRPGRDRLYVTADRDAPYTRVLQMAEAARVAGATTLDLAADCPRGESLLRNCAP